MGDLQQIFDETAQDIIRKAREEAVTKCDAVTGWRASFTLREFASPKPQNLWFSYPRHLTDDDGYLADATPEGEEKPKWTRGKKKDAAPKVDKITALKNLIEFNTEEIWTVSKVMEQLKVTERSVWNYLKKIGYKSNKGVIVKDPDSPLNKKVQPELPDEPPF